MAQPTGDFFSLKLSYSPLWFFILFLTADALLVFAPVSLAVDLTILLFGLLVPFAIALILLFKNPVPLSKKNTFFKTEWFEIGPWLWALFAVFFIITRFYKLTTLPWPISDDGYIAYFAKRLATQGDWRILYGSARVEPLFIWGLAAWFKLFQSSLLALKTFPIIVYVGVLTVGYFAARRYFSKTISFMTLWFLAFNFWTFFINRQCQVAGSLLLFECLVFYFLGAFLLSASPKRSKFFWLLAFCTGIGFYTYTAWPVVAAMVVLPVIGETRHDFPQSAKKFIGFIFIPFLLVLPLIFARFSAGGTTYLQSLLSYPAGLEYVEALFWNGYGLTAVDPSKLGYLNPCLGALFLTGFLELWRFRLFRLAQWIFFAFFLFLLPGGLTNFFEVYRITPILPLCCVLAALGASALFSKIHLAGGKKLLIFILLGSFSLGLDIYHYVGPGQFNDWNFWISNKRHFDNVDFSRAYPLLEAAHKKGVPLVMFTHLNNINVDQTLNVVTSPFDSNWSAGVLSQPAPEAAILVNCNYEPFLKKEFPDSEWTWLSSDLPNDYGGLMLGFIPVDSNTEKILERWKKADEVFKENNEIYLESVSDQPAATLKDLYLHYPLFQGDRFLESVFWDKVAFYEVLQSKIPDAIAALKTGMKKGYATSEFYSRLGDFFAFFGYKAEAEGYFQKAIRCPVNRTTAVDKLKQLKSIEIRPSNQ